MPGIWEKWRKSSGVPKKEEKPNVKTNLLKNSSRGGTTRDKETEIEREKKNSDKCIEISKKKESQKKTRKRSDEK